MLFQVWWRKHEIDCEVHPALLPILPVMDLNESSAMHASKRHFPSVLDLPDLAWPLDPAHCVPVDIHSRPHSRISRQNSYNAGESSIGVSLVFQMYQKALDESTQYTKARWIAFVALNTCFLLRIVLKQACYFSYLIQSISSSYF